MDEFQRIHNDLSMSDEDLRSRKAPATDANVEVVSEYTDDDAGMVKLVLLSDKYINSVHAWVEDTYEGSWGFVSYDNVDTNFLYVFRRFYDIDEDAEPIAANVRELLHKENERLKQLLKTYESMREMPGVNVSFAISNLENQIESNTGALLPSTPSYIMHANYLASKGYE